MIIGKSIRYSLLFTLAASISATTLAAQNLVNRYGSAAPETKAQRTIMLNKNYVNVTQGETVKFVTPQGESFTWTFDTWTTKPISLSEIALNRTAMNNVTVYVEPNPLYRGGSN